MAPVLELDRVTLRFGSRIALQEITLRAEAGEVVGLVGGNGAGKTTLLALAAGIIEPDAGTVRIAGEAPHVSLASRRVIGYVADRPLLYESLTARENLAFFARLYGLTGRRSRIDHLLQRIALDDRSGEPVATFSAGMRRRLDLARAVLHRPRVLLLDEPATSLDPAGAALLDELVTEARVAAAVLVTGHAEERIGLSADRIERIAAGQLVDAIATGGPGAG